MFKFLKEKLGSVVKAFSKKVEDEAEVKPVKEEKVEKKIEQKTEKKVEQKVEVKKSTEKQPDKKAEIKKEADKKEKENVEKAKQEREEKLREEKAKQEREEKLREEKRIEEKKKLEEKKSQEDKKKEEKKVIEQEKEILSKKQAIILLKEFSHSKLEKEDWYKKIKSEVKAIVLYGSVAKEENRVDSDVDILVFVPLKIEEKYTKGEYFITYKDQEINVVLRSLERLRKLANEKYYRKC